MPGDRDVNEVEITSYRVDPNVGIRNVIQCFDFFWANYLTGNKNKVPLPYDIIYDNGKTDWLCVVLPEISCLGHWKDSGFILKAFLIKTDLNTSALQTKYLGFTVKNDETPKKDVSVGMYDYFMQVQLNTGFGAATNKKYLVHLHRGFSSHKNNNNAWLGDKFTGAQANQFGVYEKSINYGFSYTYKPVRTDNIYSDNKYRVLDATKIPPKKYLDIYETITGNVNITFNMDFASPNTYQNLPRNTRDNNNLETNLYRPLSGPSDLPPNFNLEGQVIYNPGKSSVSLNYVITAAQLKTLSDTKQIATDKIDRSDYTLNIYAKLAGIDNKAVYGNDSKNQTIYSTNYPPETTENQKNIDYGIQKPSSRFSQPYPPGVNQANVDWPTYYSNYGSAIYSSFYLNVANNVKIQNKKGLCAGGIKATHPQSTNTVFETSPIVAGQSLPINYINLKYEMVGEFGNGYGVLSDNVNSTNGIKLYFPKKIRSKTKAFFYDKEAEPEVISTLITSGDLIRFKINLPLSAKETTLPTYKHNTDTVYDFHNAGSYAQVFWTKSLSGSPPTNGTASNFDTSNLRFYGYDKSFSVALLDGPQTFNDNSLRKNVVYNQFDLPEDSPVYFKGRMLPAFIYNRKNLINLNSFVTINLNPATEPLPSLNYFPLNAYRYLRIGLKPKNGDVFDCKYRVTIWENSGNSIIEKYYDLSDNLYQNRFNYRFIDLMFPDFPGLELDNQDDPYPRLGDVLDDNERKNNVYYGCNRIVRIDIHSLTEFNTTDFTVDASTNYYQQGTWDTLRFNPSNGKDTNLKKLSTSSNDYGRRFLLLYHNHKPEEETDIVFSNNTTKILTISEFVNRLNSLHKGIDIKLIPEASNYPSTFLQGQHYNLGRETVQSSKIITAYYDSVNNIPTNNIAANTFYYSDIFEGTYLDFPPFIQDFNQTTIADSWITSNLRRAVTASYHLDLISYVSLRGYAYGTMDFRSFYSYLPYNANLFENITNKNKGISRQPLNPPPINDTLIGGYYNTLEPYAYPLYDYTTSQNNKIKITTTEPLNQLDLTKYVTFIKMLPNKSTRVSFGRLKEKKENPYIPPIAKYYTYFSAAETRLKNEITVLFGQTKSTLDPYKDPALITKTNDDGTIKVLTYNSYTNNLYPFATSKIDTTLPDIYGFNPVLINQNIPSNLDYIVFSETYRYDNFQGLVFSNSSTNGENSWAYFNDYKFILSKIFKNTTFNTYAFSPNYNDIYALGIFNNQSLILQAANIDQILKIETDRTLPALDLRYSQLIDGTALTLTQKNSYFPELLDYNVSSIKGTVNKTPSIVLLNATDLVIFYTLRDEKNIIYYKLFINQELSERQILFRSSDFCRDVNAAISNYSVYFDFVSKRLKMIFMLTSNNVNNIFYTEFDYSSGVLNNPSIFHHVVGKFVETNFISQNTIYDLTLTENINTILPYQKPTFSPFTNIDQKGQIGVFYVNNIGDFFVTSVNPFNFIESQIKITVQ